MKEYRLEDTKYSYRVKIFKLIHNERCYFDEFCEEVKRNGTYVDEINAFEGNLKDWGKGLDIPPGRYKKLVRNKGDKIADFEMISPSLRLFYISEKEKNKILLMGCLKSKYDKALIKMRKLKTNYKNSL